MSARRAFASDILVGSDGRLFAAVRMLPRRARAGRAVLRVMELTSREAQQVLESLALTAPSFLAGIPAASDGNEPGTEGGR